eukprot:CAMPEP_0181472554 /NCGR_PEP_ID=MMETSP1110-20121109/39664_1 /TAXON_ID=174948 /ORGANISM="Symbiodinium sp., Strain CCMP421" /LENGTH=32 /DNA_ID= /DNA_START= /DNA_END= /DNA_ORIENTATION=
MSEQARGGSLRARLRLMSKTRSSSSKRTSRKV